MKNIPLVVGNRVTYKVNGVQKTILITDNDDIEMLKDLEILNVEAFVKEKKEQHNIMESGKVIN